VIILLLFNLLLNLLLSSASLNAHADGQEMTSAFCHFALNQRKSVVTEAHGMSHVIRFQGESGPVELTASQQTEYEFRADLPSMPYNYEDHREDRQVTISSNADLLKRVLRDFVNRRLMSMRNGPGFYFAPLSCDRACFHSTQNFPVLEPAHAPRPFVRTLEDQFYSPNGENSWQSMSARHWVGFQVEESIYWDTADLALMRQGIAVRKKTWTATDPHQPIVESLFVKRFLPDGDNPNRIFAVREEYQLPLTIPLSPADLARARLELLRLSGAEIPVGELKSVVHLENQRYGVDFLQQTAEGPLYKTGFAVLDDFVGTNLLTGKKLKPKQQVEVEILPAQFSAYSTHRREVEGLLGRTFLDRGAHLNLKPKYVQVLESEE
jgi:hypothetical protein